MKRIVVGVDGSEPSAAALRWAVDEGRVRDAEVEAVHAWSYPPMTSITGFVPPPSFTDKDLAEEARAVVERMCEAVEGRGTRVVPKVVHGPAAAALLNVAEGADLLVVGSRGRGGFAGLLLGSVSQQVAQHAPCPVVIVRGKHD